MRFADGAAAAEDMALRHGRYIMWRMAFQSADF